MICDRVLTSHCCRKRGSLSRVVYNLGVWLLGCWSGHREYVEVQTADDRIKQYDTTLIACEKPQPFCEISGLPIPLVEQSFQLRFDLLLLFIGNRTEDVVHLVNHTALRAEAGNFCVIALAVCRSGPNTFFGTIVVARSAMRLVTPQQWPASASSPALQSIPT